MVHPDNAVTELAEAVARIGRHEWPPGSSLLSGPSWKVSAALGTEFSPQNPAAARQTRAVSRIIRATLRNTVNPTGLKAGYKVNVIPQQATAEVDGRYLPGHEEEFFAEIDKLLGPGVTREFIHHDIAVQTTADGPLYEAMTGALLTEDPGGPFPTPCSAGLTRSRSACSASAALGSRRCGCPPISTFPECSTASTSVSRSMACGSVCASLTGFSIIVSSSAEYSL